MRPKREPDEMADQLSRLIAIYGRAIAIGDADDLRRGEGLVNELMIALVNAASARVKEQGLRRTAEAIGISAPGLLQRLRKHGLAKPPAKQVAIEACVECGNMMTDRACTTETCALAGVVQYGK